MLGVVWIHPGCFLHRYKLKLIIFAWNTSFQPSPMPKIQPFQVLMLQSLELGPAIAAGEKIEGVRWPVTMAVLSVLLVLCVVLLVGVARHNRCALIAFSVCGLIAVIASYLMASLYVASGVAMGDLCVAPDRYLEDQIVTDSAKEILRYYILQFFNC